MKKGKTSNKANKDNIAGALMAAGGGVGGQLLIGAADNIEFLQEKPAAAALAVAFLGYIATNQDAKFQPLGYGMIGAAFGELTEDIKDRLAENDGDLGLVVQGLLGMGGTSRIEAPTYTEAIQGVMDIQPTDYEQAY